MIKFYIPVGGLTHTTGGVALCKEVPLNENHCASCVFYRAYPCVTIACSPIERPDGKSVIFLKEGGED